MFSLLCAVSWRRERNFNKIWVSSKVSMKFKEKIYIIIEDEEKVWDGFWVELCNKKKYWDRKLMEDFDAEVGLNEIWKTFIMIQFMHLILMTLLRKFVLWWNRS